MTFPTNPNLGPIVALVTAFLSAVMDLLTAFKFFAFDANERTAVLAVATSGILLGLFLFSVLHVTVQNAKLANPTPSPAPPAPPVAPSV